MKTSRLLLLLSVLVSSTALAQTNSVFSIYYDHAGLTRVEVKDGKLVYTWHTERKWDEGQLASERQDISSYDCHQVEVWLTPQELSRLRQWGETNRFSRFRVPFPARAGAPSYGSAFQTTLAVVRGGSRQSLAWNGDNQVPPEVATAVQELIRLCQDIEKRRRT